MIIYSKMSIFEYNFTKTYPFLVYICKKKYHNDTIPNNYIPMKKRDFLMKAVLVLLLLTASITAQAKNRLFQNGKSSYRIVVSEQASPSEKKAAEELQSYIEQISGARLPITNDENAKGRKIFVGFNAKVAKITGETTPEAHDEGFTCRTVGKDLLIYGGAQRGTMYGVFYFLENELGVRWLTPKCTIVPKADSYTLSKLEKREQPALTLRYVGYHAVENAPEWSAHNLENMKWTPKINEYGNIEAYWNAHTMGQLLPAHEFFESHPEYFSLRDGKRIPNGQLCLSNPEVLEICKTRLANTMRTQKDYYIYSLSQNDNFSYCQCDKCTALSAQYGGQSGILIWFVNQVADAVKDEFPGKYVGTFAYQYTRQPPKGIAPRENVVIRLCSIECCFAHPLTAGCPQNQAFMNDLKQWSELAPHLFIWDYIVDYAQYIAPWPNFQVLGPNIETFRQHKAIGIYEESQYQSNGAEFEEMKTWCTAKLLWNPKQDVDSLVNIFIDGYYGKAAPMVLDYYRLCQSLVRPDVHFGIYIRENHEIYNDDFIRKAFALLDQARQNAENEEIANRVERVRMQPLYLYCKRHRDKSKQDGKWDELRSLMLKYKARPEETVSLEKFIQEFGKDGEPKYW